MEFSESTNNLFSALSKFQQECPQITKDATVNVKKNGKFAYKFDYATYGNILKTVKPVLSKNELAVVQNVSEAGVQTIITHSSGQWMKSGYLPIQMIRVEENGNVNTTEQERGSSITYMKRYQLAGMLLQDADMDDDANTADGNEPEIQQRSQPEPEPTKVKKKEPKKQEEPETKTDDSDSSSVEEFLAKVEDKTELITWWKQQMDNDEDGEFRKAYQPAVFKRLEELK